MNSSSYIPISSCDLTGNELKYLESCIKNNWISSLGSYIQDFETHFSRLSGTQYALSCSNGTVALHLALLALDIKPGDEVIVPSFTFIATVNAILYCGAKPVFVDVDPVTWCLEVEDMKQKVSSKTKAIIAVHVYGNPAAMKEICSFAKSSSIYVVEDCAEGLGAILDGKPVGSWGDISCFSFYGNKVITSGEGGMVCTDNASINERMKMLRDQYMSPAKRYYHEELGYNYRMTNIQAAIALAQLERIDSFLERRKEIFDLYFGQLNIPQIQLPFAGNKETRPVNWLYTILVKNGMRDSLIAFLKENDIDSRPVFIPCHKMPYINDSTHLAVTEKISSEGISLPTFTALTDAQIERIANTVKKKLS